MTTSDSGPPEMTKLPFGKDIAPDEIFTGLHALDGRHGQTGRLCQHPLVHAQERTGRSQLRRSNHGRGPRKHV